MTDLFLTVLDTSLSACWIVLAVLAARLVLKKAPKWVRCSLWALVALRLLCPFSLESDLSLVPPQTAVEEAAQELMDDYVGTTQTHFDISPEYEIAQDAGLPTFSAGEPGHFYVVTGETPATPPTTLGDILPKAGCILWLAGIAVLLLYAAISYLRIRKNVAVSISLGNRVYLCDYIDTPFILGIVQPRIYLPSEMDPKDAAQVLAHERAHLRRRDHWWKPLGYLLLCLHWFNPLLWLAYILLCRDIELACDERVIRDLDIREKKAYSEALLKCSVKRHMIAACPLAFGEVSVKQRIKSVLNYKKPGFWILVVSVLIIVIIAVCFLTDPQRHTLANILDLRPKEIQQIHLWTHTCRADFETENQIEEIMDFLDTVEYDPIPAAAEPITGDVDENNWNYYTFDICYPDGEEHILFNYDYSLVWTRDSSGVNSLPYRVKKPQRIKDYLNNYATPVKNRESTAKPFAAFDQPVQWLHGISLDAIRAARSDAGFLNVAQTRELLSILNSIPDTAIGAPRFWENYSFDSRIQSMPYIRLQDDANDLTGILTCYNGSIEFSLVNSSYQGLYFPDDRQYSAYSCSIDSSTLRSFFLDLAENPPNMLPTVAAGLTFQEEREVLSNGDFTLSFQLLETWDYEIIRPEDGEAFFGFRCRPKKETDGWITFGWWEDGFSSESAEESSQSNVYGYHYTYTHSSSDTYSYERAHCSHGDFVTIYENTSSWKMWYQELSTWLYVFMDVTCELPHTMTTMSDDVCSTLIDTAYYDWDAIARQLGTQNLALFDPQYYEDYLFVGLSHEEDYHIACFRQVDTWDYEFVKILDPVSKSLPRDKTKTIPVADFEQDGHLWQLYVIDEASVTGIQCHSGFWGYFPVQGTPSLFLIDTSLWEDNTVIFDLRYDTPPLLNLIAQSNGSKFEFGTSPQYYLYDCMVNYNDGKNPAGSYSLNPEELTELADILLSLPALTENVTPISNQSIFDIANHGTPNVYFQMRLDDSHLYMWGENGVHRLEWGDVRLELFCSEGNVILGVNMTDLDNDFYRTAYYFAVESEALETFMLDKCDNSRKQFSLDTE